MRRKQALAARTAEKILRLCFGGEGWVSKQAPASSIDDSVTQAVIDRAGCRRSIVRGVGLRVWGTSPAQPVWEGLRQRI